MKIQVNAGQTTGRYVDPTVWQNSTLRYAPPKNFPAYLEKMIGRAKMMRVWITLDEYWDYKTGEFYPDYDIGTARYPLSELHYPYDWKMIVPAPSGTRFVDYLTSHAACADQLLLNVRRLEREVSDGIISYDKYEEIFEHAVEYCKALAPNIRYVECCNEVELKSFGQLTADEHVNIFLRAHRAVRRLNERHSYEIPLEIGTNAVAHPLHCWHLMKEIMAKLKETEIGDDPMDFYAYHYYEVGAIKGLVGHGMLDEARLSGVEQLKLIYHQHEEMRKELHLPRKPVFLDELGRARATGVDGDSLYNAAGLITYLLAFGCQESPELYPFPWCTFHNPNLQISYTQFVLRSDGSYAITPNGVAVKMLHELKGERLACRISESETRDEDYTAVAVADGESISVLVVNPSGVTVPGELILEGLVPGIYVITGCLCDSTHNNAVTTAAYLGQSIEATGVKRYTVGEEGRLRHIFSLERDAFVRYRIVKEG